MGANIVRRRPPVRAPQPEERRQTTELSELQLRALILDPVHDHVDRVHDDLEAELELVDALPAVLPEATPTSFPSASSLRLAHTMRRGSPRAAVPAERTDASTTAIPPLAPARTATVIAMPRVAAPAPAPPEAAPPSIVARPALPPVDFVARAPQLVAGTRGLASFFGGRAAVALLVVLLLALGALMFLVR